MKSHLGKSIVRSRPKGLGFDYGQMASSRRRGVVPQLLPDAGSPTALLGNPVAHPGVARALRFMAQHFHRPIQVQGLTELAGLSRRGFFKAFLRHTGIQPAQVLRQFRIERAQQLLQGSESSLAEVAAQCGYRSANSFWVSFRQVTGVAPGQYRKSAMLVLP